MGLEVTKSKLQLNVSAVVASFYILLGLALYFPSFYDILKDFSSIFVAIAAAFLAYCFQRRQTFLTSLREVWQKCVEAKGELVQYTFILQPTSSDFAKAQLAISTAIDMIRGVYKNVGENDAILGLFPFEPLHDMRRALDALGFQGVSPAGQKEARHEIKESWNAFRWSFLQEISAPKPERPITERRARDPRRV